MVILTLSMASQGCGICVSNGQDVGDNANELHDLLYDPQEPYVGMVLEITMTSMLSRCGSLMRNTINLSLLVPILGSSWFSMFIWGPQLWFFLFCISQWIKCGTILVQWMITWYLVLCTSTLLVHFSGTEGSFLCIVCMFVCIIWCYKFIFFLCLIVCMRHC